MLSAEVYCFNNTIGAHKEKIEILSSVLHTRLEFEYVHVHDDKIITFLCKRNWDFIEF